MKRLRIVDLGLWSVLFLGGLLMSGCASIFCGSEKTINIASQPSGAEFQVVSPKGKVIVDGTTPTNVTLRRGRGWFQAGDYTVKFTKEGYKDNRIPVKQGLETGWYLGGNLIFGGLVGLVLVDPLTGAMWNLHDVDVRLSPVQAETKSPAKSTPPFRQGRWERTIE